MMPDETSPTEPACCLAYENFLKSFDAFITVRDGDDDSGMTAHKRLAQRLADIGGIHGSVDAYITELRGLTGQIGYIVDSRERELTIQRMTELFTIIHTALRRVCVPYASQLDRIATEVEIRRLPPTVG